MADIELVIKIPEEVYKAYKRNPTLCTLNADQEFIAKSYLINGLINGVPLPKGHGALKDTDAILKELSVVSSRPVKSQLYMIKQAPTLVEASKEEGLCI